MSSPGNSPTEGPNTKGFIQIMTTHKAQNDVPNQSLRPLSNIWNPFECLIPVGDSPALAPPAIGGITTETNSDQLSAISVRINILNPTNVVLIETYKLAWEWVECIERP
jgi:hypothetical protein